MSDKLDKQRAQALAACRSIEEIGQAGAVVAEGLRNGESIEVTLAPGNGGRYTFLFTPIHSCRTYETPRNGLESKAVQDGGVWVSVLASGYVKDATIYPLALMGRDRPPAPSYVMEKWFPNQEMLNEDVFVLEALLDVIGQLTVKPAPLRVVT